MVLSANPEVQVASDPYLPLFRSLRNAIVREGATVEDMARFDWSGPLLDYYFTDDRIRTMDAVQAGALSLPFDPEEWITLRGQVLSRVNEVCQDLAPYIDELNGLTYEVVFDNALRSIAVARNAEDCKWVGHKEVWTLEFFAPLARAYPDAKFIVIHRDPRAVVNSHLWGVKKDPSEAAPALSYARHWRKYAALTYRFQRDELLADRLHVLTYEELLGQPEEVARELCDFLEVEYHPAMLDTDTYFDFATGSPWTGNSSFETATKGINTRQVELWRETLEGGAVKLVDFVCGAEMGLLGYEPGSDFRDRLHDPEVLEYFIKDHEDHQGYSKWRSDFDDPQKDYGFELFRRALLTLRDEYLDRETVRRSFLFEDVYAGLRQTSRAGQTIAVGSAL